MSGCRLLWTWLVCAALVSPFSIKLLACFSMPLCALLSGWILSGSFLLAGYLLSPAFLPPCRILAFCIAYAGISGLGGGLLHGLPFGERRPHEGDTSQGAVGENRATGRLPGKRGSSVRNSKVCLYLKECLSARGPASRAMSVESCCPGVVERNRVCTEDVQ